MTKFESVNVELKDRSYSILIGENLLRQAGKHIKPLISIPRVCIITDNNVAKHHLVTLKKSLNDSGIEHYSIILPAGEKTKSFKYLEQILEKLLALNVERKITLIALGGGVIGDLTGFAASVLLRGVAFIQIPTTLLSMVDSSVGGKTGINTRKGKNLVGSFYQPKIVLADTSLLKTLPMRQMLAGYAEVVKYGLINNPEFFTWLEQNLFLIKKKDPAALQHIVKTSCEAKAEIVRRDEKESGERALLNLGHTFAHALELATGYSSKLLHGEAVSIGMVLAFRFSAHLGLCPEKEAARAERHLSSAGLPTKLQNAKIKLRAAKLISYMKKDKKVSDGKMIFILARGIGKSFISKDVKKKDLAEFLNESL